MPLPPHFYDHQVTIELGLEGDLQQLFYSVGWQQYFNMHDLLYKRITFEFLSTFEIVCSETKNPCSITFQLMNEPRQLNKRQLIENFGWPTEGLYRPHHNLWSI